MLSDYERRILDEIEHDLSTLGRRARILAWLAAWRVPLLATVLVGGVCAAVAVTATTLAAVVVVGVFALGLGLLYGWQIARHS